MSSPKNITQEIFNQSIKEAKATCAYPWVLQYSLYLPGTTLTTHRVFMMVAGILGVINVLIALYLLCGHYFHWTHPYQQRQYTRMIFFIISLTVVTFLEVVYYHASVIIDPVGQLFEVYPIIAIFLLYVHIIAPDAASRDAYFEELKSNKKRNMRWFRRTWIFVFQIALSRIVTLVGFEALYGTTCPLSPHRSVGRTIFTVIQNVSTIVALVWIIMFEHKMRPRLEGHRSFRKLIMFRLVVPLQQIQALVFAALAENGVWVPSKPIYTSYNDFMYGLPPLIFMAELFLTAVSFLWAYEFAKYRRGALDGAPVVYEPSRAVLSTFSLRDIWQGLVYAFTGSERARDKAIGDQSEVVRVSPRLAARAMAAVAKGAQET